MKNKSFLPLSTVLVLPGVYAITRWFMIDATSKGKEMSEMEALYTSVLPFFQYSFAYQKLVLLALASAALYFILQNRTLVRDSFLRRSWRRLVLVLALLEIFFLLFAMM